MGFSISQPWDERLPDGRTVDDALRELLARKQALPVIEDSGEMPGAPVQPVSTGQPPAAQPAPTAPALNVPDITGGGDITAQLEEAGDGDLHIGADGKITITPTQQVAQPQNVQPAATAPPTAPSLKVPDLAPSPASPPANPAYGEATLNELGERIIPFNANPASPSMPSLDAAPVPSSAPGVSRARVADPVTFETRRLEEDRLAPVHGNKRGVKQTLTGAAVGALGGLAQTGTWEGAAAGAGAGAVASTVDPDFVPRQQHEIDINRRESNLARIMKQRQDVLSLETQAEVRRSQADLNRARTAAIPVSAAQRVAAIANARKNTELRERSIGNQEIRMNRPRTQTKVLPNGTTEHVIIDPKTGAPSTSLLTDSSGKLITGGRVDYSGFLRKPDEQGDIAEVLASIPDMQEPDETSNPLWHQLLEQGRAQADAGTDAEAQAHEYAWNALMLSPALVSKVFPDPSKSSRVQSAIAKAKSSAQLEAQTYNEQIHRIQNNIQQRGGVDGLYPETPENFERKLKDYRAGKFSQSDWQEYVTSIYLK